MKILTQIVAVFFFLIKRTEQNDITNCTLQFAAKLAMGLEMCSLLILGVPEGSAEQNLTTNLQSEKLLHDTFALVSNLLTSKLIQLTGTIIRFT